MYGCIYIKKRYSFVDAMYVHMARGNGDKKNCNSFRPLLSVL